MIDSTKTLCPYCGVGCGLEALPPAQPGKATIRDKQGTPIWQVRGDRDHPSSQGMVCVKGATIAESLHKDRLQFPMMRESLDEPFRRVSWDEALDRIRDRIQTVRQTQGADAICMYGSGQLQTEDYYIAQKLMKGCLGTNNFDANSRLCMSSAVSGYIQSFGADGPPCCYDDLDETDCAFIAGSNLAECHPILFNRLRKHHKQDSNVKLVVIDPRCTPTAEVADLHLAIKPGTDIDLFNGIGHLLLKWGKIDADFVDRHTSHFSDYAVVLQHYSPDVVAHRCGISEQDLETAARYWGDSKRVLSMWSMGLNQSSEGTAKVRTLINLHLMTAQIGKPGAGPFSLTGQPNAMGGREAGGLSHLLPGYRLVNNPADRAEVEQFWRLEPGAISATPGLTCWEMMVGLEQEEIGVLWVAATNPAVSMPDIERTKAALKRSPFTVYQDVYYPTETAAYAHVLLPAAQWSEKTGVMVNSERRVTLCPKFRSPPGQARADWAIFAEVGRRLGFTKQFAFNTSAEVYSEFAQLTHDRPCDQSGISHARLRSEGALQWPLSGAAESIGMKDAPSISARVKGVRIEVEKLQEKKPIPQPSSLVSHPAKRLYTDFRFHTPDGRARFAAHHSRGLAEPPDEGYPYVLTTGRLYGHWHTLTRTGRIEKIMKMHPNPFIEIHPRDAAEIGVKNDEWVEVRSRRGFVRLPVLVTKAIAPGTLFVPMHWGALWANHAEANALTHPACCPDSKQPELKACAVQVVPIDSKVAAQKSELIDEPALAPLMSIRL
jgi:ferredoxin-nitrate reductase